MSKKTTITIEENKTGWEIAEQAFPDFQFGKYHIFVSLGPGETDFTFDGFLPLPKGNYQVERENDAWGLRNPRIVCVRHLPTV